VRKGVVEADLDVPRWTSPRCTRLQKTRVRALAWRWPTRRAALRRRARDPRFAVEGRAALAHERLESRPRAITTGAGAVEGKGTIALKGARNSASRAARSTSTRPRS
jgi:hypothetical protein